MRKGDGTRYEIRLVPATAADKPVLANLFELYCHDFCDFVTLRIGPDGRFGFRDLDLYWTHPDVHRAFFVYADGGLAGFVVVDGLSGGPHDPMWDIAQFFILRGFRRSGVGSEAAHEVWRRFPGRWQVRVMVANEPACRFWDRTVRSFAGNSVVATRWFDHDREWHRFRFESRIPDQEAGLATDAAG
jgi:predicted acetyltransferase